MAWENIITGKEYPTEDEARDSILEIMDDFDLAEAIDNCYDISLYDIVKELRRLDSPLYYKLFEYTYEAFCEEYISEIDEEE